MQVITGRGRSLVRPEDWWLDYILARRNVENGAPSVFLTVIDAYQKDPVVKSIRLVSERPLELEVTRDDGVDLIHLHIPLEASRPTAFRPLGVRVQSFSDGTPVRDVQIGHWAPDSGPGYVRETIKAVDYDNNRIAIDPGPDPETDLAPGRAIRIYNQDRSALYRILSAGQEGDRIWITLDATALLARGPVTEVQDGQLSLGSYLTFAAGGKLAEDGDLAPGPNAFAGSWLGEGEAAQSVRGAVQGRSRTEKPATNRVFLKNPVAARELEEAFKGRVVSIWQYGVGDSVEVARVECSVESQQSYES